MLETEKIKDKIDRTKNPNLAQGKYELRKYQIDISTNVSIKIP